MSVISQLPPALDVAFVAGNPFAIAVTSTGATITAPAVTMRTSGGDAYTTDPGIPTVSQLGAVTSISFTAADTAALNTGTGGAKFYRWSLQALVNGTGPYELVAKNVKVYPVGTAASSTSTSVTLDIIVGGAAVSLSVAVGAGMTAADILTAIKTVDGAGSGLDADLLDGISSAGFGSKVTGLYHLADYGTLTLDGTGDNTATLNAALTAMYAAGGGTLVFPTGKILCTGQIILPNDGGGIFATGAQLQPSMAWLGQAGFASGQIHQSAVIGGTTLILTYTNATYNNAKIVTRGLGQFDIQSITFQDTTAASTTPFIYTTNTTLKIERCAFLGASIGSACAQDAIVLGGTIKNISTGYDNFDSAFQGYGTVITRCYFNRVRRAIYGRSYCNQVQITNNFMDKQCGTNLVNGACIEFDGGLYVNGVNPDTDYCTNNVVTGNYMEWTGDYYYQIKLRQATRCYIGNNGFVDSGANRIAGVRCESKVDGSGVTRFSFHNMVIANFDSGTPHLSEDTASLLKNPVIYGAQTEGTVLNGNVKLVGDLNPIEIGQVKFTGTGMTVSPATSFGLTVPNWTSGASFYIQDAAARLFFQFISTANGAWSGAGPLTLTGNTFGSPAGTTKLTIGNNSTVDDAVIIFNPPTGQSNQIQWKRAGANSWLIYDAASTDLYIRDSVNGVMALELVPGSGVTGRALFGGTVESAAAKVVLGSSGPQILAGAGTPEGAKTAPVGSTFHRSDGAAATSLYVKVSGAGNTGWVAVPAAAPSTGWAVSNVTPDKVLDANATTIDELADVVGTLITYLISRGDLAA